MLSINPTTKVFIKAGATDGRLGMDGLAAVVTEDLGQDPASGFYFAFCNKAKNRLRVLACDGNSMMLFAKRLERSTFQWPKNGQSEIDAAEFQALLSGLVIAERRGFLRRDLHAGSGGGGSARSAAKA